MLIVDDQFPELIPKVRAAIRELGGGDIDFAINTHWHFDHAQGNLALGAADTWLVSHANSRQMMTKSNLIDLVVAKYRQQPVHARWGAISAPRVAKLPVGAGSALTRQ